MEDVPLRLLALGFIMIMNVSTYASAQAQSPDTQQATGPTSETTDNAAISMPEDGADGIMMMRTPESLALYDNVNIPTKCNTRRANCSGQKVVGSQTHGFFCRIWWRNGEMTSHYIRRGKTQTFNLSTGDMGNCLTFSFIDVQ
jgi:hypothetical protein